MTSNNTILKLQGKVIHGFKRGSKELGCPTANIPIEPYEKQLQNIATGVYFGWANVNKGTVYKAALSIGWNPHFKNVTKTIEVHLLHKFESDFYGNELRCLCMGYIREEQAFKTLDDLITAIRSDIDYADKILETEQYSKYKSDVFFRE